MQPCLNTFSLINRILHFINTIFHTKFDIIICFLHCTNPLCKFDKTLFIVQDLILPAIMLKNILPNTNKSKMLL